MSSNESRLAVTGLGRVVLGADRACDPSPFLKVRKSRKYMGVQDELAVVAAGRALESAGLAAPLGERAGLYLAIGYIPFREEDIGPVLEDSIEQGRFSMKRFGEVGYPRANPLLTFRCLPNMPAYHVSVNFDLQGPYLVTYPGVAGFYRALEEAVSALEEDRIDCALVGGVAHQRNFLVAHHFRRIEPSVDPEALVDAAAILVLERGGTAQRRGARVRGRLDQYETTYVPFDPREQSTARVETLQIEARPWQTIGEEGPGSLVSALARAWEDEPAARVAHHVSSRDGVVAASSWTGAT